jgi:hypothetical protein
VLALPLDDGLPNTAGPVQRLEEQAGGLRRLTGYDLKLSADQAAETLGCRPAGGGARSFLATTVRGKLNGLWSFHGAARDAARVGG